MNQHQSYTVNEATQILARYCAYQERSHKEVEIKLKELRMIPEAREQIILYLLENNFLNEERFAKAFASGKFSIKKWGKLKIKNELRQRAVTTRNIELALLDIQDDDYSNTLKTLAEKKWLTLNDSSEYIRKGKLVNYLVYKGFEHNLIYEIVNELVNRKS